MLEGRVQHGEPEQELPCEVEDVVAQPSSILETVVDSQELVAEEGSRVQVVENDTGSQRPLTQAERAQIEHDELVEEEAAEMARQEEERQWSLFAASHYRSWEEWAVSADERRGSVKRARVQILVQGLGGRVVKDENWLVPLGDGEQLTYTVKVQPAATEDTEDEGHPEAASSGLVAQAGISADQVETCEDGRDSASGSLQQDEEPGEENPAGRAGHVAIDRSVLPVTGWESGPVLGGSDQAV